MPTTAQHDAESDNLALPNLTSKIQFWW